MKYFIPALLAFLLLLNACSKGSNDPKPAPSPKDTLSSGWTKTNLTDTAFLTDIVFFDNNIGYTVNRSNIYRSTNGGTTWNKVLQSNQILSNIAVPGLNNALFLSPINIPSANSSKLFITTDGGNSFDSVVINDVNCSDVFFVSPTIGYLSGRYCWKTTDGGFHWTAIHDFGKNSYYYKPLFFLDEQTGWMSVEGLYKTTDGGLNWVQEATPGFNPLDYTSIYFTNPNKGFIADSIGIGLTTDGGLNWNKIYTPRNQRFHDLHFLSETLGYMTDGNSILKTTDGGYTWTKEVTLVKDTLIELHFTDVNHGWACGSNGTILRYVK